MCKDSRVIKKIPKKIPVMDEVTGIELFHRYVHHRIPFVARRDSFLIFLPTGWTAARKEETASTMSKEREREKKRRGWRERERERERETIRAAIGSKPGPFFPSKILVSEKERERERETDDERWETERWGDPSSFPPQRDKRACFVFFFFVRSVLCSIAADVVVVVVVVVSFRPFFYYIYIFIFFYFRALRPSPKSTKHEAEREPRTETERPRNCRNFLLLSCSLVLFLLLLLLLLHFRRHLLLLLHLSPCRPSPQIIKQSRGRARARRILRRSNQKKKKKKRQKEEQKLRCWKEYFFFKLKSTKRGHSRARVCLSALTDGASMPNSIKDNSTIKVNGGDILMNNFNSSITGKWLRWNIAKKLATITVQSPFLESQFVTQKWKKNGC